MNLFVMNTTPKFPAEFYRTQHKQRLSYMPWLYYRLKPNQLLWAKAWQQEIQQYLCQVETIILGKNCFIAPQAQLFAEPGRPIIIGDNTFIAADSVIHGPVTLGEGVAINHHCTLDGGKAGITIGNHSRLAAYCTLYAFNHGLATDRPFKEQAVTSSGIILGEDVWLGAQVGVVDGVMMGDHSVAGMSSVVTKEVPPRTIVAGNPARPIGHKE